MIVAEETEYRQIPRFTGYRAGCDGSIWSQRGRHGLTAWRQLKTYVANRGYHVVNIIRDDGRRNPYCVHELICAAYWGGKPTARHEVRHLDGVKTNNKPSNLAWGTRSENQMDRVQHGSSNRGSRQGRSKICERDIPEIVDRLRNMESCASIASSFGVELHAISEINTGKNWRWLTSCESYPIRNRKACRKGEGHPQSILTSDDVRMIRRLHSCGHANTKISAAFSVSVAAIQRITSGKGWTHVE